MDYLNLYLERIVKSEEFHLVGTTPESPGGIQSGYYGANRAVNAITSPLQNQSQLLFLDSLKLLPDSRNKIIKTIPSLLHYEKILAFCG